MEKTVVLGLEEVSIEDIVQVARGKARVVFSEEFKTRVKNSNDLIREMINKDIVPYAPGEGSIGYLAVEGFFVMAYMGEGRVWLDDIVVDSKTALEMNDLKPLELTYKEGLSMLNGSMSVCAYAAMGLYDLKNAARNIDVSGSLAYEALKGNIKALDG